MGYYFVEELIPFNIISCHTSSHYQTSCASNYSKCYLPLIGYAVETERYRAELARVRAELEPWEKQLIEHKGKIEVACTESKLLSEKVRLVPFHVFHYNPFLTT